MAFTLITIVTFLLACASILKISKTYTRRINIIGIIKVINKQHSTMIAGQFSGPNERIKHSARQITLAREHTHTHTVITTVGHSFCHVKQSFIS